MHQTFEKSSLAMTHKLDDIIQLPKKTNMEDLDCEIVWVEMPRCITWDKVDNPNLQNTLQVLPSFKVCTPLMTYPKKVEETIGIPMEVEHLDQSQLEDLGLNTCSHDISLSSRKIPSFDEPDPQPQPLPSYPSLDLNLRDKRVLEPPIKPHSPNSFRMNVVDNLTIHTPPSPHVVSFYPKDVYCYYHPCIDDPIRNIMDLNQVY
ncbi:hypothetical protein Tco_1219425 [Tanacetum coccineum]